MAKIFKLNINYKKKGKYKVKQIHDDKLTD